MVGFDQHAAENAPAEDPREISRNARWGMALFLVYLVLYSAFVGVSTFHAAWMATLWQGVNLAIWSGFGLIGVAFVLAMIYSWLCRARAPR